MTVQIKQFDVQFTLEVEPTPNQTVGQLLEQEEVEVPENFTVLVNMAPADMNAPVKDNDVVLVIPPIEGGC